MEPQIPSLMQLSLTECSTSFPGVSLILENLTVQGGEAFDGGGIFVAGQAVDNTGAQISSCWFVYRLINVNIIQ